MDELTKVHHSLVDWQFEAGSQLHISAERFISPPSSLCRPTEFTTEDQNRLNLKESVSGNLRIGRVVTNTLFENVGFRIFKVYIRSQEIPSLGEPANTYILRIEIDRFQVIRTVGGDDHWQKDGFFPAPREENTWYLNRITWFTYIDATLIPVFRILADIWSGGAWVNKLSWDDTDNLWYDAAHNYVGFSLPGITLEKQGFMDDTEVWGPG